MIRMKPGGLTKSYAKCHEFEDFDEDGNLINGKDPVVYPIDDEWLHNKITFDPASYTSMKGFIMKWKSRYENAEKRKHGALVFQSNQESEPGSAEIREWFDEDEGLIP